MPMARYFLYVGGVLLALLLAIDALAPQDAAVASHAAPGIDKSTVRIHSDRKLPDSQAEKVESHVSVAFLLCFEGVGKPCFGVFQFYRSSENKLEI